MASSRPPLALIAGPTASGKSALAIALAQASGGVIVNADSAQVYSDLPILSAAPSESDCTVADHRLFGFADGDTTMSAAHWAALARDEIASIHGEGRLPILVGGTGLYLRTLLDGIAPVPDIDPAIRAGVRGGEVGNNYRRLQELDLDAASRLNPADTTRIARALEVILATGRPLAEWQKERVGGIGGSVSLLPIILLPPREWLYRRCDERFEAMIAEGAPEEVKRLLERGLPPSLPVMRAIGVAAIKAYLDGKMTLSEAIAAGKQATRNYAKRQYTWFSHQVPADWPRFTEPLDIERALESLRPSA